MASSRIALAMMFSCILTGILAEQPSCTGNECLDVDRQDEFSVLQVNISQHTGLARKRAPNDQAWKDSMLREHNELRAKHGAPALTWCEPCAVDAKKAASNGYHSNHDDQGQNIFMAMPAKGPKAVVEAWYNEISQYNWGSSNQPGTGHFTQVVWCGTTQVGCAATSDGVNVVCNYKPGGNMLGDYKDNVPRVGGTCGSQQQPQSGSRNTGGSQQQPRSSSSNTGGSRPPQRQSQTSSNSAGSRQPRSSSNSGGSRQQQPQGSSNPFAAESDTAFHDLSCAERRRECEAKPGCRLDSCEDSSGGVAKKYSCVGSGNCR